MIGFPSAPFTAPSQSPLPVGLTPDLNPSGGARLWIVAASRAPLLFPLLVLLGEGEGAGAGAGAGWFLTGGLGVGETSVPASIAFCCKGKVVETTGHPFPGPFKFWSVMAAAFSLADLSALESPVGKDKVTVGLLRAFPA